MILSRSAKTADKRILLFTNEDDPFGSFKGASKTDMTRTTLQRAEVCSSRHHLLITFVKKSSSFTKIMWSSLIVIFFFLTYILRMHEILVSQLNFYRWVGLRRNSTFPCSMLYGFTFTIFYPSYFEEGYIPHNTYHFDSTPCAPGLNWT